MDHSTHKHIYDKQGNRICCNQEEKIYKNANAEDLLRKADPNHKDESGGHDHSHENSEVHENASFLTKYLRPILSSVLLVMGLICDNYFKSVLGDYGRQLIYGVAYILVAYPVVREAVLAMKHKSFFNEFTLMTLATVGALAIGEYPEGVAVMLFYSIGELFQEAAVNRAKASIKALLDLRPNTTNVLRNGSYVEANPADVTIGEVIQVRNGESISLDGKLKSSDALLNTAALTGESAPREYKEGQSVLAGMLNAGKVIEVSVEKLFANSSISKILDMVQNASTKKAKTELMIRKFAKIYTPVIFVLAIAIIVVPYFVVENFEFNTWIYRALVFLVISCPCALVISIPLGYFGGIGAASKNGILFKGSNYLDVMTKVNCVVMDKTGTLTTGVFSVQEIESPTIEKNEFLRLVGAIESKSTHPIAAAVIDYISKNMKIVPATAVEEISGHGLKGNVDGKEVLVGNAKLLKKFNIAYPDLDKVVGSVVIVAIEGKYAGYISVADTIKEDAALTISEFHKLGITAVMLSGDKNEVTQKVAQILGIKNASGDLLPEDKVKKVEDLKKDPSQVVAFVGDGINDAPVLALSDVGIAMGAMGSDAAIETANVVIQTDQPSKIIAAIKIAKATRAIVIQNISLSFIVKVIVLVLGAGGLATMWEAVFADVGVALLAIINAMRIQRKSF